MATDPTVPCIPEEFKAWLRGFSLRVDEHLGAGPVDVDQLTEHEFQGYMDALVGEAIALTSMWIEEQAARQREVDEAQDSASACGWPSSSLF